MAPDRAKAEAGTTPSTRIWGILARRAPVAVLFRRGPSQWFEVIRWDLETDQFDRGAWHRGRIYVRRCDLAPNGDLLAYFCNDFRNRNTDYTYAWTAVSRPPWLTALALWPKGDCWNGGGIWLSSRHLLLNHPEGMRAHAAHQPHGLRVDAATWGRGEDSPIFHERLKLAKWTCEREAHRLPDVKYGWSPETWVRSTSDGRTLRMTETVTNLRLHRSYELADESGDSLSLSADWADCDRSGRVLHSRGGSLYADGVQVADFSADAPDPRPSPPWAHHWPHEIAR